MDLGIDFSLTGRKCAYANDQGAEAFGEFANVFKESGKLEMLHTSEMFVTACAHGNKDLMRYLILEG